MVSVKLNNYASGIKNCCKLFLAYSSYYTGIIELTNIIHKSKINVLTYHQILPANKRDSVFNRSKVITDITFAKQMAYLTRNFKILSLNQMYDILISHKSIPKRAVAITFDDGYRDNYEYAFPILKKYKIPATIFLTTDPIDKAESLWWDDLSWFLLNHNIDVNELPPSFSENIKIELRNLNNLITKKENIINRIINNINKLEYSQIFEIINIIKELKPKKVARINEETLLLTWDMAKEMLNSGLITFGAHTMLHPILTNLSSDDISKEIQGSKKRIEDELGITVDSFSFPKGKYNSETQNILKNSGVKLAFTTDYGANDHQTDLLALRRKDAGFSNINNKYYNFYYSFEISTIFDRLLCFRK